MDIIVKGSPRIEIEFESKVTKVGGDFDASGTYPDLVAGDLAGHGESVPAEFTFRASGGKSIRDGRAYIKAIKGNSVVWNQQLRNSTFLSSADWFSDRSEFLVEGGVAYIKATGGFSNLYQQVKPIQGHTYLILADAKGVEGHYLYINFCSGADFPMGVLSSNFSLLSKIFVCGEPRSEGCQLYIPEDNADWAVRGAILVDLTLMFGAGNEPTTIEEFYSLAPSGIDLNAYNEGEVIAFNGDAVKSVGDNAWDEQWEVGGIGAANGELNDNTSYFRSKNFNSMLGGKEYTLLTTYDAAFIVLYDADYQYIDYWNMYTGAPRTILTDERTRYFKVSAQGRYDGGIMVRLTHSGWKDDVEPTYQPYREDVMPIDLRIKEAFPQGMHKWDKVYNKDGKGYIVKGTGSVDLGDYDIIPSSCNNGEHRWLIGLLNSIKPIQVNSDKAGMISVFPLGSADSTYLSENGIGLDTERDIWLYDSRYTNRDDIDNVRQMLQGVMLYYELAEPTIIEYDKPFKLDYKVADFGTEELLSSMPSAPFNADIIYQFNAVDMIREHELEITELQKVIATMQAQLASLTNN